MGFFFHLGCCHVKYLWGSDQVASFPTKIAMKLLWVWLGDGEPRGHPKDILKGAGTGRSFGTGSPGGWLFFAAPSR